MNDKCLRWKIIGEPFRHNRNWLVKCRCRCGTVRNVVMIKGRPKSDSCGCAAAELRAVGVWAYPSPVRRSA